MPETIYICPKCEEEIEYLNYKMTGGIEYGEYYIEGDNYEQSDTDFQGETHYECPECEEEIERDDVIEKTKEPTKREKTDEQKERENEEIRKKLLPELSYGYFNNLELVRYIKCTKCKTEIIIDEEIEANRNTTYCTKCKTEIKITKEKIIKSNQ